MTSVLTRPIFVLKFILVLIFIIFWFRFRFNDLFDILFPLNAAIVNTCGCHVYFIMNFKLWNCSQWTRLYFKHSFILLFSLITFLLFCLRSNLWQLQGGRWTSATSDSSDSFQPINYRTVSVSSRLLLDTCFYSNLLNIQSIQDFHDFCH